MRHVAARDRLAEPSRREAVDLQDDQAAATRLDGRGVSATRQRDQAAEPPSGLRPHHEPRKCEPRAYNPSVNEFVLQAWERELHAWERRLTQQPSPTLDAALHALAEQLESLRQSPDADEALAEARIREQFGRLRRMYEAATYPRA
jgi:hypothetical protein